MKLRWFILLLVLIVLLSSTAVHGGIFDLYPNGSILFISALQVDLGLPHKDPAHSNGRSECFEKENALYVGFWAQVPDWQILLAGEDFVSGGDLIPLTQLRCKSREENGNYKKMPPHGRPLCILEAKDFKGAETRFHLTSLSFKLDLKGDEKSGRYTAPFSISMVFP